MEEEENEDGYEEECTVLLTGQHDRPVCLQNGKTVTFQNDVVGMCGISLHSIIIFANIWDT